MPAIGNVWNWQCNAGSECPPDDPISNDDGRCHVGPVEYTGLGKVIFAFSSKRYDEQMENFDKYVMKNPGVLVAGPDHNISIGKLKDQSRSLAVWIKADFENNEANKTSRFFYANPIGPIGQRASPIASSEFESNKQALDKLENILNQGMKNGGVIDQPFMCRATTVSFP
jgi:hypothetical protein